MSYRSTKEKDNARANARQLYIRKGLSLEDIHQQTGETLKTLRAWRNLGEWDILRDNAYNPELQRLRKVRDSLLDRIETQFTDSKLPHTEIGLLAKVDSMITRHEARVQAYVLEIVLAAFELLLEELHEHNPDLAKAVGPSLRRTGKRIFKERLVDMLE